VAVSVSDLDVSVGWYEDVLGAAVTRRYEIAGHDASVAVMSLPGLSLELLRIAGATPRPTGPSPKEIASLYGFAHIAFMVDDCDAAVAAARERGVEVLWEAETSPESGFRAAHVADPDGNDIEFVAPLPVADRALTVEEAR